MTRWWALALLGVFLSGAALADDDLEKDLRDLQGQAEGMLNALQRSTTNGVPGSGQLDVARRKVYALATDRPFLKAVDDLWASPKRNELLIAQGIFFVVVFLVRAWRQAKAKNWFTRICVGLFFTLILWAGLAYVIPAIVLGEPYRLFVATLWRVLTSG